MKRLSLHLTILLAAITFMQFGGAQQAEAFCIYNHAKSTAPFKVFQTSGFDTVFNSFKQTIAPGKRKCCNWKNDDCNAKGKKGSSLGFQAKFAGSYQKSDPKTSFSIPAGGVMTCLMHKGAPRPVCPPTGADLDIRPASLNSSSHTNVLLKGVGGKCLEIGGGNKKNGANVNMWKCHGGKNQRWTINRKGEIKSVLHGKCLDANRSRMANRSNVGMWHCWGGENQRWEINHGRLAGPLNLCLDAADKKGKNGSNVHMWKCHKGANQQWRIADKP